MTMKPLDFVLPDKYGDAAHPTDPVTGQPICGAYKKHGKPNKYGDPVCLFTPMENGRCKQHGGKTPSGMASPHYRGRGHMRRAILPHNLKESYEASLDDPELLNMSSEIALIDAQINVLLEQLNSGASAKLWDQLKEANDALEFARLSGNPDQIAAGVNAITAIIKRGASDRSRRAELNDLIERRRRVVATASKQRRDEMRFITEGQMLMIMHEMAMSIQRNVTDANALRVITQDMKQLIGGRGGS